MSLLETQRKHIAERVRAWGESAPMPLAPRWRRGDGRAEILSVETIGENGAPTVVWRSGELAVVKVRANDHSNELRLFHIDNDGIHLGEMLVEQEGLLGGSPSRRRA